MSSLLTDYPPTGQYERFPAACNVMQFYYIGNNPDTVRLLTAALGEGYHCGNPAQSADLLRQFAERNLLQGPVVLDGQLDEQFLDWFGRSMMAVPACKSLIFILDGSSRKACKQYSFVLESFALSEQNVDRFVSHIAFLKRMKTASSLTQSSMPVQSFHPIPVQPGSLIKRSIDVVVSLLLLILLSPLFALIALVITLESKGPVLYISKRAGKGYRVFHFYKFRTMVNDADGQIDRLVHLNEYALKEGDGPAFFKLANDPRCTRVGRVLRATSLDEIPQFYNVLRGDMSLVGNRPLPLKEAVTLTTDQGAERFMAPAGITGLWQIRKKDAANMTAEERLHLDIAYASRQSLSYDLWIMAQTPRAMLQKAGS